MGAIIAAILAALIGGAIFGYRAYDANLKREGWRAIWNFDRPVGEGRLRMIEPAEVVLKRYRASCPWTDSDKVESAFEKTVQDWAPKKGKD